RLSCSRGRKSGTATAAAKTETVARPTRRRPGVGTAYSERSLNAVYFEWPGSRGNRVVPAPPCSLHPSQDANLTALSRQALSTKLHSNFCRKVENSPPATAFQTASSALAFDGRKEQP